MLIQTEVKLFEEYTGALRRVIVAYKRYWHVFIACTWYQHVIIMLLLLRPSIDFVDSNSSALALIDGPLVFMPSENSFKVDWTIESRHNYNN